MTERMEIELDQNALESQQQLAEGCSVGEAFLREKVALLRRRSRAYVSTHMVGRDAELQQLLNALYQVIETQATHTVIISGEPGIGKSRLLQEFIRYIKPLPEPLRILQATADQQMHLLPYALIRDLFAALLGIYDDDPITVARQKLEHGVVAWMGTDSLAKAHFIGYLLGFDFSASPYLRGVQMDALQIRDRAIHYAMQLLTEITAQRPCVCILEDIHWADDSSLDFLEWLAQEGTHIELLLVCLTRPDLFERRPGWDSVFPRHTHLNVRPLSDDDSRRLVMKILHTKNVPPDIRELIVRRAEGNPFYIEELIGKLVEDGVLVREEQGWQTRLHYLTNLRIPATLTEVLQAREDMLPPLEREVLRRAAVVGHVFWDGAVAFADDRTGGQPTLLHSSDSPNLTTRASQKILESLQRKELIVAQTAAVFTSAREYRFRHALLQEVVYDRIPTQERQWYHARAATWLIHHSGERVGEYVGTIAEHYARAGETELAAVWYERAGKQASAAYAPEAAIGYYHQALAFLPAGCAYAAQRIAIYKHLGRLLGLQARFAEAQAIYTQMREIAEEVGDLGTQAHAGHLLAWALNNQGDLPEALAYAEQSICLARQARVPEALVMALFRKGWILYHMGEIHAALAAGEEALEISTELHAKQEMACSLNLLGVAYEVLGQWDRVVACKRRALALHQELGDLRGVGIMLNNLGTTAEKRGDLQLALTLFTESLNVSYQIGDKEGEIFALCNLGWTKNRLGDYAAAEIDVRRGIERAEAVGLAVLPGLYAYLTEALLGQGKVHDAILTAQHALDLARQSNRQGAIADAWRVLGMAMACLPEPNGAAVCFAEAVRILSEIGAEVDRACVWREWAKYELKQGDRERGRAMWHAAWETFTRLHMEAEVTRMGAAPA